MERINELVLLLQNGQMEYFDEFYDCTKKLTYHVIINIVKRREVCEDLMQDTYIKFINTISYCDVNRNVLSYLLTIARNLSINHYNKSKREVIDENYIYAIKDDEKSDVELGIIDILDENLKEVVIMHIIGNMKFKDISLVLNKPLGTVLWLYNKAIKIFRKEVRGYEEK